MGDDTIVVTALDNKKIKVTRLNEILASGKPVETIYAKGDDGYDYWARYVKAEPDKAKIEPSAKSAKGWGK